MASYIEINNLGSYANIGALWAAYPEGGQEGDYCTINSVKYHWDKYDRMWIVDPNYGPTPARSNENFDGDVTIQNNLTVAGYIRAKGIKQPCLGLYDSSDALSAAWPQPEVGMWALVGDSVSSTSPAAVYRCDTEGTWAATGGTAYIDDVDLSSIVINAVKGWVHINSISDLPSEPTEDEKSKAYLLGTTLYVWDITEEEFRDADIKGPKGDPGGQLEGYRTVVNDLITGGTTDVLSAEQGKVLNQRLNYDAPVYDKADFDNIFGLVGDIGVHAYLKPNNTTTLVLSDAYRYFWVKVAKGDTIYTWTKGYSDVVTIGFSASRKLDSNFVVVDSTGGTKQRSATASADGYFYVGVQYSSSGTPLENRVWVIPQPAVYKEYTLDAGSLTVEHLQLNTGTIGTGKIVNIGTAPNTNDSITMKVNRGDKVCAKVKQDTDCAAMFFTREAPESGNSAVSLVSGTGSAEDLEAIALCDGYITVSYLRAAYISNLKIETPYAFREVDGMKTKIDSIETEITDFSQGIIKDWDVLKSNSVVRGERNSQVSYLFHVEKGAKVKVKGAQYVDTALLSFSETMPSVGGTVEIAFVGAANSTMPLREYVAPKDGYVMATLRKDVSQTGSMISITKVDYDSIPIPHIAFESLQAEASSEMSANDVINNIYEPLRQAHPEYIKRKSLGKDASNTYDIWLYEFDNSVDEWFSQGNDISYYGSNLVDTTGLDANQFRIAKSDFDSDLATLTYKNLYVDGVCDMRKPVLVDVANKVEETVDGTVYYKFTAAENVKVYTNTDSVKGVKVTWTKENKTYDQHVMLVSGVHGTEPTGFMGTALALKYLVEHHDNNKTLDYIYNHVKLSVIPVVNMWGTNQSPKVRNNSNNKNLNDYTNSPLAAEQQIVANYVASIKDELSCFLDLHTSEVNNHYGMVYAMTTKNSKLMSALTAVSGYLCKHWFPTMPPFNWNIGTISASIGSNYMKWNYDVEAATVEFCGKDLRIHGNCDRWSAKYMTYAVENYINYIIAACALRLKNNTKNIISNPFFGHSVMG